MHVGMVKQKHNGENMRITMPKSVQVGKKKYRVVVDSSLDSTVFGETDYQTRTIRITKRRMPRDELEETFWHEIVHAALHDQRSPLYSNEAFVTALSRRLHRVIRSVKFT